MMHSIAAETTAFQSIWDQDVPGFFTGDPGAYATGDTIRMREMKDGAATGRFVLVQVQSVVPISDSFATVTHTVLQRGHI